MSAGQRAHPRVAVVLTQLGYGGAERQTAELLRRLVGSAWEPALVICLSEHLEPYGPELCRLGYRLEVLPRSGSFDAARLWRLRRLLVRERIGLVHAVHLLASGYVALATGFGRRVPMLPTIRGARRAKGRLRRAVYRRMLRRCPVTLVNSQSGRRTVAEDLRVPAERMAVVPNGLDFAELDRRAAEGEPLRAELGAPDDAPVLLYVGKHAPVKDVPRLMRVLASVLDRHPRAHAVLAGPGLDPDRAADLGAALPLERTHWLGPRDDVPRLMAGADVLVLTSRSEGCPNVVLEALALGTPTVSGDVGDVRDILGDPLSELVVPRDRDDAYGAALDRVLSDRRRHAALAGNRRPELERRFGMEAMVAATVETWSRLG